MPSTSFDPDALPFRRALIVGIACVGAVVAGAMLADQPYLIFAGLAGLIYIGTLTVNCRALAWLVIALQPAALIVPFFPGRPFWWELCALLAWPSLLAYGLVNRRKIEVVAFDRAERWALAALGGYVVVLLGLMAYRGVGFRAFGGAQMGGRFYAQQLVLAVVPLLFLLVSLTKKQILWAAGIGWGLSLTYLISDFSFTGGGMNKLLYFFELPPDAVNFELGYELTGLRRYQSLWCVGAAMLSALLVWMPLSDLLGRKIWIGLPLLLAAILLALGSGHRTVFVKTAVTFFLLASFQRFWTPGRALAAIAAGVVSIGMLYWAAADLPLSLQRAVSFLPGIEVAQLARDNALDTLSDRVEVLKLAIKDVPQYLIAGRGFGMERLDLLPGDGVHSGVWLQYSNGFFYNGLIGSLLKTGLPGLICSGLMIWWVSRMACDLVARVNAIGAQSAFERLSLLCSAQWFASVFFFYTFHGDVAVLMQIFSLPAAMVMLCRRKLDCAGNLAMRGLLEPDGHRSHYSRP